MYPLIIFAGASPETFETPITNRKDESEPSREDVPSEREGHSESRKTGTEIKTGEAIVFMKHHTLFLILEYLKIQYYNNFVVYLCSREHQEVGCFSQCSYK